MNQKPRNNCLVVLKNITKIRRFGQLFQYLRPYIHVLRGELTDISQCIKCRNPELNKF